MSDPFLEALFDPDSAPDLHILIENGNLDGVKEALEEGADVNENCGEGDTHM